MKWLSKIKCCFISLGFAGCTTLCAMSTGAREETERKPVEISASLWKLPKERGTLLLTTFRQSAPVQTVLTSETQVEGVCIHCNIEFKYRTDDLGKRCAVCPCGFSNAQCLTGKASSAKSWTTLLQDLPRGTRLRIEYTTPEKPGDGLKRMVVDRHGVLLPVEGLMGSTPEQRKALGKSVGAIRTEWNEDEKRLQITLKDNWTTEKESRLEKALAKLGARVVSPEAEDTT
jgi:hypothetical protein